MLVLDDVRMRWVAGGTNDNDSEIVVIGDPGEDDDDDDDDPRDPWEDEDDPYDPGDPPPPPPPPPTIDQMAERFANKAVERGLGFDPTNPVHQQIEARVKQDLQQAYKAAHDAADGTARLTNGSTLTDAQMHAILNDNLHVTLQTTNITTGDSGDYFRANNEDGVLNHYITLDLDHANFATLTNNFGSRDEAFSFALGHELGHAFDREYRGTSGTNEEREAYANFYAFELGNAFGFVMPTRQEVTGSGYTIYQPNP